jgi:hypothetical protein
MIRFRFNTRRDYRNLQSVQKSHGSDVHIVSKANQDTRAVGALQGNHSIKNNQPQTKKEKTMKNTDHLSGDVQANLDFKKTLKNKFGIMALAGALQLGMWVHPAEPYAP